MLALGARAVPRYEHAMTIDDRRMDETLHGLIQDIEGGYIDSVAFVSPGRMAWPLPLYELALMTAGRAYDMNVELAIDDHHPRGQPAGDLRLGGERRASRELLEQGAHRDDQLRLRRDPERGRDRDQPRRPAAAASTA